MISLRQFKVVFAPTLYGGAMKRAFDKLKGVAPAGLQLSAVLSGVAPRKGIARAVAIAGAARMAIAPAAKKTGSVVLTAAAALRAKTNTIHATGGGFGPSATLAAAMRILKSGTLPLSASGTIAAGVKLTVPRTLSDGTARTIDTGAARHVYI